MITPTMMAISMILMFVLGALMMHYQMQDPPVKIPTLTYATAGGTCPCADGFHCKEGNCYETCVDKDYCFADNIPRINTYSCDYSGCDVDPTAAPVIPPVFIPSAISPVPIIDPIAPSRPVHIIR